VDGKYLVPDGELAAGTAYLALDSMGLRGRNVIPLESITMLTRIRYARADGTFAESWVSSDMLTENDAAPAAPKREPIPTLESYQITLNGTAYTAFAINKVEKGYDTFADIAGTQTAVVDVLTWRRAGRDCGVRRGRVGFAVPHRGGVRLPRRQRLLAGGFHDSSARHGG